MKLYSVFDNDQWVADMTADDIAEMIGCTREQVIRAVSNASVINDRYTFVYDGDIIVTGNTPNDRRLLKEFILAAFQIKGLVGA
jgi:hypothetical protein|nr:MAG TPA: replication initiator protein [Caudoviricetes sp.]